MKILAVGGGKGGPGKTTLAVNLATIAAAQRYLVACFDVDPQQSLTEWGGLRTTNYPELRLPIVRREFPAGLEQAIKQAEEDGADVVIVDTAGKADSELLTVAELADLVLMPAVPTRFDLSATIKTHQRLSKVCDPPIVVLTRSDWRGPERGEARATLEGLQIEYLETTISERKPYHRSTNEGLGVIELPKTAAGSALSEVLGVAREVWSIIGLEWREIA